jgi:hypothetical protein
VDKKKEQAMPLELDSKAARDQIIIDAGGIPIGERPTGQGDEVWTWFIEPVSDSTCVLDVNEVSLSTVVKKLNDKRKEFGISDSIVNLYFSLEKTITETITTPMPPQLIRMAARTAIQKIMAFEAAPEKLRSLLSNNPTPSTCTS